MPLTRSLLAQHVQDGERRRRPVRGYCSAKSRVSVHKACVLIHGGKGMEMTSHETPAHDGTGESPPFDTTVAHQARMYDYADEMNRIRPEVAFTARAGWGGYVAVSAGLVIRRIWWAWWCSCGRWAGSSA
jgi:hypothetical protein